MIRRRALLVGAGVVALAGLGIAGPRTARKLEFFRVRRIEFRGIRYLSPRALAQSLRLRPRASVFDDPVPLERRVLRVPGVLKATVGRRLPGTLVVAITEATPVALVGRGGALGLMDSAGRVLPFDPVRAGPDLPVLAAPDPKVGALLRRVQEFDPALFARVQSAAPYGSGDVALTVDGGRLIFRPDATLEEMRGVTAVAQDLARRGLRYQELDGRFSGQVVVRGSAA